MKRTLRRMARWIGWSTDYHVSAIYDGYNPDRKALFCTISLTVNIFPWLHCDNYIELVECVNSRCENPVSMPTIISITKLGV